MAHRHSLALIATAAIALFWLPQDAAAQQKPLKDQIVGGWYLVSNVQTMPDGTTRDNYGANPKGINIFSPDGRFVVLFARNDLPKIAAGARPKATNDEARAIIAGSIGYFGTYSVDEGSKTISYRIEGTTFPNQAADQKRVITAISANELRYRNPSPTTGGQIEVVLRRGE
jgi:hypothetical protein